MRLYICLFENSFICIFIKMQFLQTHGTNITIYLKWPQITSKEEQMFKDFIKNENWCTAERLAHSDNIFKSYQVGIVLCVGAREQKTKSFLHLLPWCYFLYGDGNMVHSAESHLQKRWFLPTLKTYPKMKLKGGAILFRERERGKKEVICWKIIKNNRIFFLSAPPSPLFLFCFAGKKKFTIQQ